MVHNYKKRVENFVMQVLTVEGAIFSLTINRCWKTLPEMLDIQQKTINLGKKIQLRTWEDQV